MFPNLATSEPELFRVDGKRQTVDELERGGVDAVLQCLGNPNPPILELGALLKRELRKMRTELLSEESCVNMAETLFLFQKEVILEREARNRLRGNFSFFSESLFSESLSLLWVSLLSGSLTSSS